MKKLKDFLFEEIDRDSEPSFRHIDESSLFDKGVAIYQKSKHTNSSSNLKAMSSKVQNLGTKAKSERELIKKLDAIIDIQIQTAHLHSKQAEMSTAIMNTLLSSSLLDQDVEKALEKVLSKYLVR